MPPHASPLPSTCACPAVNPNVEIKEVPARTLVALSWHGSSPREAEVERRTEQLRQLMAQAGLKPKAGGKTHVWQYGEGGFGRGWVCAWNMLLPGVCSVVGAGQPGSCGNWGKGPEGAALVRRCASHARPHLPVMHAAARTPFPPADPPFQWSIFRTNEVLIEVDGDAARS